MSHLPHFLTTGVKFNVLDFSPYAWYDSKNTNTVASTTTATDLGSFGHDLSNPAATNQPTLNVADVDFNGEDSYTFDGTTDYLSKNVANYGSGLTSGETHIVVKPVATKFAYGLCVADVASNNDLFASMGVASNRYFQVKASVGAINDVVKDSLNTNLSNEANTILLSAVYTGSAYMIYKDGVLMTVAFVAGGDNGHFLSALSNVDNVAIGALLRLTKNYGSFKWGASGIFPVQTTPNRTLLMGGIKTRYGIT